MTAPSDPPPEVSHETPPGAAPGPDTGPTAPPRSAERPSPSGETAGPSPLVKLAIELGPLLVFFLLNARKDIYWATGGFMVAIVASLVAARVIEKRFPVMPLVTAAFVLVFGSLTLYLQDDRFIKLKPTLVNSLFAVLLFAGLLTGRSLLKVVFGSALQLEDEGWRRLTFRWACFFVALAVLNEVVWRSVSTDAWVAFKTFGILPLTIVFMLTQAPLLARYQIEDTRS